MHRQCAHLRRLVAKVLGERHPDTLASINNLALLVKARGRFDEAERLYRTALDAAARVWGWEHPNSFTALNNLASVLLKQVAQAHQYKAWTKAGVRIVLVRACRRRTPRATADPRAAQVCLIQPSHSRFLSKETRARPRCQAHTGQSCRRLSGCTRAHGRVADAC